MAMGGEHTDSVRVVPGTTSSIDIEADNIGTWLLHCHINLHLHFGMQALFRVHDDPDNPVVHKPVSRERVYYIKAEDSIWDYAPKGKNVCDGTEFGEDESIFTKAHYPIELSDGSIGFGIGSRYIKTRYIEYTDATFATRIESDASMEHLGIMGPVLRARVGEAIIVHFRNGGSKNTSVHPHGVLYTKANEGAPYNDGTSAEQKKDDSVPPGGEFVYRWPVPKRAGPGPGERSGSKLWMYHSHRSEVEDTNAGLFGAILVISNESSYDPESLLPSDGKREIFLHFSILDENDSLHLKENILRDSGNRNLTDDQLKLLMKNSEFKESNKLHAINGYIYCNSPILKLRDSRPVRFYFYALGSECKLISIPMSEHRIALKDLLTSKY